MLYRRFWSLSARYSLIPERVWYVWWKLNILWSERRYESKCELSYLWMIIRAVSVMKLSEECLNDDNRLPHVMPQMWYMYTLCVWQEIFMLITWMSVFNIDVTFTCKDQGKIIVEVFKLWVKWIYCLQVGPTSVMVTRPFIKNVFF